MAVRATASEKRAGADLLALSMSLLDQANFRLNCAVVLGVAASAVSLATILLPVNDDPFWGSGLALAATAAAVGSYVMFRMYEGRYDLSCQAKRVALLENGLGWSVPGATRTDLRNRAGKGARDAVAGHMREAETYYASLNPPGAERLLDNIQESAFFTYNQYRPLRNVLIFVLMCVLVAIALAGWFGLQSASPQDLRVKLGQLLLAFIPATISLGLVSWSFKLDDLASAVQGVYTELEQFRGTGNPPEREVLRLMGEYNCQIAQGVPIPWLLWLYLKSQLNALWDERRRP